MNNENKICVKEYVKSSVFQNATKNIAMEMIKETNLISVRGIADGGVRHISDNFYMDCSFEEAFLMVMESVYAVALQLAKKYKWQGGVYFFKIDNKIKIDPYFVKDKLNQSLFLGTLEKLN